MKDNCLFCNCRELATYNSGPDVWLLYNYRVAKDVPKFINGKEMRRKESKHLRDEKSSLSQPVS